MGDQGGYLLSGTSFTRAGEDDISRMIWERGPGYPAFLAFVFAVRGLRLVDVRLAQGLVDCLTCLSVYLLARLAVDRVAGVAAGVLAATSPGLILSTNKILSESVATAELWLGVLVLYLADRARALWLVAVGSLWVALACLTRPTLIVAVPFLVLAVGARGAAGYARWLRIVVAAACMLVPLYISSFILRRIDPNAASLMLGGGGLNAMWRSAISATDPVLRGWTWTETLDQRFRPDLIAQELPRLLAAANLIFWRVWFSDNVWRETFVLTPDQMNQAQRVAVVLALGGLALALRAPWKLAGTLAVVAALIAKSIGYIEIRQTVPHLPALYILGGVLVSSLAADLRAATPARRALMVAAGIAAAVALWITRLPNLADLLPAASPLVLGRTGDIVAIALAVGGCAVLVTVLRWQAPAPVRARAAAVPAALFAVGFAAYALVESSPRWRAWHVDLTAPSCPIEQEISLFAPLGGVPITEATWFVDMKSPAAQPPVAIWVNEAPAEPKWSRAMCNPAGRACEILALVAAHSKRTHSDWQQWWKLGIDPALVSDVPSVRLTLATTDAASGPVRIAGTFTDESQRTFNGPSLLTSMTSIYRWEVLEDNRVWQKVPLLSRETRSSFVGGPECLDKWGSHVANWQRDGTARFNIRLRVKLRTGVEWLL